MALQFQLTRVLCVVLSFWLLSFGACTSFGQATLPASAEVDLYFPQFADGGPLSGQAQTSFTFSNPNTAVASGTLFLRGNDGNPLPMDFGVAGLASQFSFSVPAKGSFTLTSKVASATMTTGWANAVVSLPIQGVASYRFLQNGVALQEVSVPSTLPTQDFFSAASAFTGVAVANVYRSASITLQITASGNDGSVKQANLTIPPLTHQAAYLFQIVPGLDMNFVGTVELSTASPYPFFVPLTLKIDSAGIVSSLPSGAVSLPVSQTSRIRKVFANVKQAASRFIPTPDSIQLNIAADRVVNAFGDATGIKIELATAELIADSDSELAFLIGHELGHVYQYRAGSATSPQLIWNSSNLEFDADIWGFYLSLLAGYDPYAGAGALAKLAMATGDVGLTTTFFEALLSTEMHKSLTQRLDGVETAIRQMCASSPSITTVCSQLRQIFHPSFPTSIPLIRRGSGK